jgi:hypothetical protein
MVKATQLPILENPTGAELALVISNGTFKAVELDRLEDPIGAARDAAIGQIDAKETQALTAIGEQVQLASNQADSAKVAAGSAGAASRAEAIKAAYRRDPNANLYDYTKVTPSASINTANGAVQAQNVNFTAGDFIPVIPGFSFSTLNPLLGGAFYTDATPANFIAGSGFGAVAAGGSVATPATANFMRPTISSLNTGPSYLRQTHIVHGPTPPAIYRSFDTLDTASMRRLIDVVRRTRPATSTGNLHDATKTASGVSINQGNGLTQVFANHFAAYIAVNGGEILYFTHGGPAGNGNVLCWLDASGAPLSYADGFLPYTPYTVPQGAFTLGYSLSAAAFDPLYAMRNPQTTLGIFRNGIPTVRVSTTETSVGLGQSANRAIRANTPAKFDLFIASDVSVGYVLNSGGGLVADNNYVTTAYIPLDDRQQICCSVDFLPGSSAYGMCFYDADGNFIWSGCGSAVAATTNNSFDIMVSGLSDPSNPGVVGTAGANSLTLGAAINVPGIPARSYISAVPSGGGNGKYTFTNAANGPATATATGVPLNWGGVLADVPRSFPANVGISSVRFPLSTYNNPANIVIANGATNYAGAGFIGWADVQRQYPFFNKKLGTTGDSIFNGTNGDNNVQEGLAAAMRAIPTIMGAVGGSRISEALLSYYPPHSTQSSSPPTRAWTNADIANIDEFISNHIANDFAIHGSNAATTNIETIWPNWGSTPIGAITDRWIPAHFTAAVNGTSITITNLIFGTLQHGLPLHGDSVGIGNTLVDLGGGNWGLSKIAPGSSGNANVYGGTVCGDLYDLHVRHLSAANSYLRKIHLGPMPRFEDIKYNGFQTGPWPGNPRNALGHALSDYNDMMRMCGEAFGFYFINLFSILGLDENNYNAFLVDGLHPGRTGELAMYIPRIAAAINRIGF